MSKTTKTTKTTKDHARTGAGRPTPENADARNEISRRKVLGWTVGGALAGVLLGQGLSRTVNAQGALVLEVPLDMDSFDSMREPASEDSFPTGPFYVKGPIYPGGTLAADGTAPAGATSIGTFRCWGWMYTDAGDAIVNQAFELDGIGELHVQGQDLGDKAVTGGTHGFQDATGHMSREDINVDNGSFRATFHLG